ncbi:hypothetical protein ABL840_26935 [Variovorax sp. NFACC27]|uniref:hypothetical protein n=1 Tax=unclassified Variovorax TaxID=663243 RepID=UPI000898A5BE|nr:hypothetical protein SAMN03159371_03662 [Variovorax sp. NFACC28]SEG77844.1 hypothetical protein SAMN03159365_03741 [Variovorax sp. NFACC29]SFC96700.1 hypothetical protein SAMN03159379_03681 [Variovorax sp. NFACC26]SFG09655.1 hypothetical protein SAMN03159447_01790 [Variovorax sp. NFACC27]
MSELSTPTSTEVSTQPTTIAQAALALFSPLENDMQVLATRHRDVVFDMSTPKGFKAAKDARLELRESGRFAIQRLRDKTKDQLNDCKKVIDGEATRLIAIVEPVETFVDEQIKVHEKKLADEKAERERIEAERTQKHLDAIEKIEGYIAKAEGLPIARIEIGLAYVREIDVSEAVFEDFAPRAAAQKEATIRALEKKITEARERAAAEEQRLENERLRAQLADLQRQQAAAPAAAPEPAPAAAVQDPAAERQDAPEPACPAPAVAPRPAGRVTAATDPAPATAPVRQFEVGAIAANDAGTASTPTLRIGDIAARLGWTMTAEQLRSLGIEPAARERGATLYHEHQFPEICAAIANRANEAAAAHAQRLAA